MPVAPIFLVQICSFFQCPLQSNNLLNCKCLSWWQYMKIMLKVSLSKAILHYPVVNSTTWSNMYRQYNMKQSSVFMANISFLKPDAYHLPDERPLIIYFYYLQNYFSFIPTLTLAERSSCKGPSVFHCNLPILPLPIFWALGALESRTGCVISAM